MAHSVKIGNVIIGKGNPLALIAGPCVIEGRKQCLRLAARLKALANEEKIPLVFKASYDKANRTSHQSYRGPGLTRGLAILSEIKERYGLPILTDVHNENEVPLAAKVVDILQCPALLCRQTDLILALGNSGKPVNIKKGQFIAPWDIRHIIAKLEITGNKKILITERGTVFGYNNLAVDMRSLIIMRNFGYPVVFDATHSAQSPGGAGHESGGDWRMAVCLARAAVATGCDAIFVETHLAPQQALSDKATMIPFAQLRAFWRTLKKIDAAIGRPEKQK
ncbi:MAG: 3-deoxy-8-phosphooctulonate synthase [Kiritimatiellia bacterium]|nr:3-deoxy-8-phosphooctulonate synthase [Kiritimatiellia bacterium]